ncbi:MAG: ribonuclease III domain-containing protein [Planctomycetota bacterium]|mgnify:FL=1
MADPVRPETRLEFAERVLGHRFRDPDVLLQGFTHASRLGAQSTPEDRRRSANERMEFLGDAVLGAAVALAVYQRHPSADEGWLSRAKSNLVSRATLAKVAEHHGILSHAVIGGQVGPTPPDSVKANVVEGIIGAVFIDGGWDAAIEAVARLLRDGIEQPTLGETDPRMALQTWSLAYHQRLPQYVTERCGGTDHAPEFASTVTAGDRVATGTGNSRKRAEAAAAEAFLRDMPKTEPTV